MLATTSLFQVHHGVSPGRLSIRILGYCANFSPTKCKSRVQPRIERIKRENFEATKGDELYTIITNLIQAKSSRGDSCANLNNLKEHF